eukprot:9322240-Pyramimonas_sp.AAC.1
MKRGRDEGGAPWMEGWRMDQIPHEVDSAAMLHRGPHNRLALVLPVSRGTSVHSRFAGGGVQTRSTSPLSYISSAALESPLTAP